MSNSHKMLGYLVLLAGLSLAHGECQLKPGSDIVWKNQCESTSKFMCVGHALERKSCPTFSSCCRESTFSCCWKDGHSNSRGDSGGFNLVVLAAICLGVCCCFAGCGFIIHKLCSRGRVQTVTGAAFIPQEQTSSGLSMQMPQPASPQPVMAPSAYPQPSMQMPQPAPPQPAMAPMQPAMVPEQPAAAPGNNQFQVTVPAGCAGGSTLVVDAPNGQQMQIVVPDGLQAGAAFIAAY